MITLDNQTHNNVNIDVLEELLESLSAAEVELVLCDNPTITLLNLEHRGIDKPTDVLSFPLVRDFDFMPLGSVVISIETAQEVAQTLGHSLQDEIALLFIHGVLHLLGYDHEIDNGEMRAKEEALIEQFGLPNSLIVRTEE
ncbi:MAG: heat-shock protein [Sulfurovum sp. PC08-66]|nr:MAG: heat-shock protein [Sulfurovum sp. PC08-66]